MLPFGRDGEIAMYKTLVRSGYAFVPLVALLSGASSAATLPLMPPGPVLSPPTIVDVSNTFDATMGTGIGPTNMFYFQLAAMGKVSLSFDGISDSIIGPVNPDNKGGGLVVLSLCDMACQAEMGSQPDAITEATAKLTAPGSSTPQTIKPGSETGPFADFFTSGAFLPAETNALTGSIWELCFEGVPIATMTGVTYSGTVTIGSVPETSTWAMMALGFAGLSFASVFSKKRKVVHAAAL
jgi:hypothetical protein